MKTPKDGLGKSQGKRPQVRQKFPKGRHGKKITDKGKRKEKKIINEMTINKDNKKVILSFLKLKDDKIVFIRDLEHSNPLLNSKTKT